MRGSVGRGCAQVWRPAVGHVGEVRHLCQKQSWEVVATTRASRAECSPRSFPWHGSWSVVIPPERARRKSHRRGVPSDAVVTTLGDLRSGVSERSGDLRRTAEHRDIGEYPRQESNLRPEL